MDTVEVPYGGSLDPAAFPEVPSDGGRYGAWAPFDHNHITRSLTVEAVYEDWVTTISSGGNAPCFSPREHSLPTHGWSWHSGRSR